MDNRNNIEKRLMGALIGLAKSCANNPYEDNTLNIIIDSLICIDNESVSIAQLEETLDTVKSLKARIVPDCMTCTNRCGNTDDYDMDGLYEEEENTRNLKLLLVNEVRQMAVFAKESHLGEMDVFIRALATIGYEVDVSYLITVVYDISQVNCSIMHKK